MLRSDDDTESTPLMLPTPRPTVDDSLALLARPNTARHTTDVSAAHDVDSLEVDPSANRPLTANPIPDPYNNTIDVPVAGRLAMLARLILA